MQPESLRRLLEEVQTGALPVDEAVLRLRDLPYEDLGFARLDHHRALRTGFPEVVYCPGKQIPHLLEIIDRLQKRSPRVLVTRATEEAFDAVLKRFPDSHFHTEARIIRIPGNRVSEGDRSSLASSSSSMRDANIILVISAGTADIPVAEEAAVTAEEMGSAVERLYDVGVAGLHRLLDEKQRLFSASVLIVVAGMEGALASVVGGLVSRPVIAVPTSVGYGASFEGLAALLAMLNSCATGVAVMNIDNGFGAGYFAHLINQQ